MVRAIPVPTLPLLVRTVLRRNGALSDSDMEAVAGKFEALTRHLKVDELARLIGADRSLYHDYLWPTEQTAVVNFLRQQRQMADRIEVADLLTLLAKARPDLGTLLLTLDAERRGLGSRWLARQWDEMRALI